MTLAFRAIARSSQARSNRTKYTYDPFGRRIRKSGTSGTTFYLWDGDRLLAEYDGSGDRTVRYAYAQGFAPVQVAYAGSPKMVYDVHSDHLDTPRMLTDSSGLPSWRASYEAFGRAHVSTDPDGLVPTPDPEIDFNIRFPGQYYDAESGLHYNRFRTYDPSTGRYISADPIGQIAGRDENLYRYVWNNPTNWLDPFGLRVLNPDGYSVSAEVMAALEAFNAFIGCDKDIIITGGDRPASSKIGSGSKSQHAKSKAADIKVPGQSNLTTANQAKESDQFGGVGWYEEGYSDPATGAGPHVHVDTRDGVAEWGYDKNGNYYNWQNGGIPGVSEPGNQTGTSESCCDSTTQCCE